LKKAFEKDPEVFEKACKIFLEKHPQATRIDYKKILNICCKTLRHKYLWETKDCDYDIRISTRRKFYSLGYLQNLNNLLLESRDSPDAAYVADKLFDRFFVFLISPTIEMSSVSGYVFNEYLDHNISRYQKLIDFLRFSPPDAQRARISFTFLSMVKNNQLDQALDFLFKEPGFETAKDPYLRVLLNKCLADKNFEMAINLIKNIPNRDLQKEVCDLFFQRVHKEIIGFLVHEEASKEEFEKHLKTLVTIINSPIKMDDYPRPLFDFINKLVEGKLDEAENLLPIDDQHEDLQSLLIKASIFANDFNREFKIISKLGHRKEFIAVKMALSFLRMHNFEVAEKILKPLCSEDGAYGIISNHCHYIGQMIETNSFFQDKAREYADRIKSPSERTKAKLIIGENDLLAGKSCQHKDDHSFCVIISCAATSAAILTSLVAFIFFNKE
jgi:hypothetical protein